MYQPMGRPISASTSLPPGIPGPPIAYLLLQVPLFRNTTRRPLSSNRQLAVRVVWWGEDADDNGDNTGVGLLFYPRIAQRVGSKKTAQTFTHTRYPVCVPLHKMQNYLEGRCSVFLLTALELILLLLKVNLK